MRMGLSGNGHWAAPSCRTTSAREFGAARATERTPCAHHCPTGPKCGRVPAQMRASPGADVGESRRRVPAQMWASPGADVGRAAHRTLRLPSPTPSEPARARVSSRARRCVCVCARVVCVLFACYVLVGVCMHVRVFCACCVEACVRARVCKRVCVCVCRVLASVQTCPHNDGRRGAADQSYAIFRSTGRAAQPSS